MGCNCGKGKNKPAPAPSEPGGVRFVLTAGGHRQEFGSKLEADAAKARLGGGTVTPQAQR
jgi:hypothetical protein